MSNSGSNTVTIIDGATNAVTTVNAGSAPLGVAVNPTTDKVYVANNSGNTVTVIGAGAQDVPLKVAISPLPGNATTNPTPTFTFTPSSAFGPDGAGHRAGGLPRRHVAGAVDAATPVGRR